MQILRSCSTVITWQDWLEWLGLLQCTREESVGSVKFLYYSAPLIMCYLYLDKESCAAWLRSLAILWIA
jgi:hypothetical protein